MASREELLQSINPTMKLDKAFFLKVYGYDISTPGFSDTAIKVLEDAGCSKARSYYNTIVAEYENKYQEGVREAAAWYRKQLNEKYNREERNEEELWEKKYLNNSQQKNYSMQQKEKLTDKLARLKALI